MTSAEETGDFTGYKDKPATNMQERFTVWIKDKLELTFSSKKEEAAFDEGVRLSTALRMAFQRSPENQAESTMVRANRGEDKPAPAKAAKATKATKAAPAKKATPAKKAAAPAEPEPEETEAEAEAAAPAAPAKRTGRAPAARRTRQAASTASAPF